MEREIIGFGGGKSGGGGSTPVETPDSLHSISFAKILDLVSEGEIQGLANGSQSIFFDGTPLQNSDSTYNFQNVTVDFRPGTQSQDYITGFPSVENETAVGVELRSTAPYVKAFSNLQLSAVRIRLGVSALSQTNTTNGNISGYIINYKIELSTDSGSYVTVVNTAFNGKTTTNYQRTHRINLPAATSGWSLKVTRLTANANSGTIADTTTIVSTTEVIDAKLRYPMSALIGVQIDASQFTNIPTRSYDLMGRIIQVPTNYDPIAGTYSGIWDGTFKPAWSNNPAWVFYDLVLNNRYGLGSRVNASQIDKWGLYAIGQYCDVIVSDGKGGTERRFTCNLYLQQQADAYKVLQDLATIFRGIAYWAGGNILASADAPSDPVYTYTAANVIDGIFNSVGSPLKSRYTVALVTWNDPADSYKQKVETVQDQSGLVRYGIQQTSITAFGCTSQGQAQRIGLWATLTSRLETQTVTFGVGLDGAIALPGQIVRIADPVKMGRRNAGRISAVSGRTITVDKAAVVNVGDPFTAILPTGEAETQIVQSISGNAITVVTAFSTAPIPQSIWTIDNPDLSAPTYRILSVVEKDKLTYEITAIQHIEGKFAAIDSGTRIDIPPSTVIPALVQPAPATVTAATYNTVNQGIQSTSLVIAWTPAAGATSYLAEWKRDDNNWIQLPSTGLLQAEVDSIYAGTYSCRVRAVNPLGVKSIPTYSVDTVLTGKTTAPPTVTTLTTASLIFGINVSWGFPAVGASDTSRTEIWYGTTNVLGAATKLADFAYPQNTHDLMGLASGVTFFFWARLVDRSGNIGAFYPTGAGVVGTSSTDSTAILAYLAGKITETQLAQSLLTPIHQIPGLATNLDAMAATQITSAITADSATASVIVTVESKTAEATAIAETAQTTIANTNGQLAAMYTIKTAVTSGGRTYAAGIGIGVDNASGLLESQVLVSADTFAVINPSTSGLTAPFAVTGGQTYINNAIIQDASITNAKIGDTIQSSALGYTGLPLWKLSKTGGLTFTSSVSGGGMTQDANSLKVYDGSGNLRVQLGNLS
jgi:predicted phage tail protein